MGKSGSSACHTLYCVVPIPQCLAWLRSSPNPSAAKPADPTQAPHSRWNIPFRWQTSHWRGTDRETEKVTAMLYLGWTSVQGINLGVPWWVWYPGLQRPVTGCLTSLSPSFHSYRTGNLDHTAVKVLSRTGRVPGTRQSQFNRNNWDQEYQGSHETWKKIKLTKSSCSILSLLFFLW